MWHATAVSGTAARAAVVGIVVDAVPDVVTVADDVVTDAGGVVIGNSPPRADVVVVNEVGGATGEDAVGGHGLEVLERGLMVTHFFCSLALLAAISCFRVSIFL
jgi:hypothetical protein